MVTIIHLPEAPNPKVGPPTLAQPRTCTIVSFDPFRLGGGGGGGQKPYSRRVLSVASLLRTSCLVCSSYFCLFYIPEEAGGQNLMHLKHCQTYQKLCGIFGGRI